MVKKFGWALSGTLLANTTDGKYRGLARCPRFRPPLIGFQEFYPHLDFMRTRVGDFGAFQDAMGDIAIVSSLPVLTALCPPACVLRANAQQEEQRRKMETVYKEVSLKRSVAREETAV